MLEQLGCEVINLGIICDDLYVLCVVFIEVDSQVDVVISFGGVLVGEVDYIKIIFEELGEIVFWKLVIKLGKLFVFGKFFNSWFCGLLGNLVLVMLIFY